MKNIAFLSFDWDYKIVSEYYLGLQEFLGHRDDVRVTVFNAFGRYYASHVPVQSFLEIFSLYDPADYDGLLIQGNRTWPPEMRQQVVDKTVALHKPVVSINYDLAGAHSVGTNNYEEEYELVLRVLQDRGCVRPAFVNGLKTSVEAQARARGFRDACAKLDIEDTRFYQANWQISAGVVAAKKMLRKPHDLPDVVFCCNDDLAVGVKSTLEEAGVRVPEDVFIAGFDNREIGLATVPRITTVDRHYRGIAVTALKMLLQLMNGEAVPDHVYSPAKQVLSPSCGYPALSDSECAPVHGMSSQSNEDFNEKLEGFQSMVLASDSLYDILENCELFARELDCPNVLLSLNDAYVNSSTIDGVGEYGSMSRLMACKGRFRTLRCDKEHTYTTYETRRILPPNIPVNGPLVIVSPVRRNEACIGLFITEGAPSVARYGFVAFFLTILSSAIEAARRTSLLRAALARMNEA